MLFCLLLLNHLTVKTEHLEVSNCVREQSCATQRLNWPVNYCHSNKYSHPLVLRSRSRPYIKIILAKSLNFDQQCLLCVSSWDNNEKQCSWLEITLESRGKSKGEVWRKWWPSNSAEVLHFTKVKWTAERNSVGPCIRLLKRKMMMNTELKGQRLSSFTQFKVQSSKWWSWKL